MNTDIQHRIEKLSPEGKKLFLLKLNQAFQSNLNKKNGLRRKSLVAFVKGKEDFDVDRLRDELKANLPDFMVPSNIVALDAFPTLPNGKVDNRQLSKVRSAATREETEVVASLTDTQNKLLMIWEEVLNFGPININDNFFEIGGDSILSIQIIAKARKLGMTISPNQLFENQTIAELSLFVDKNTPENIYDEVVEGKIPLTPIQHWFFEIHKSAPHYWNQMVKVSHPEDIEYSVLEEAISQLVGHHEALRSSFYKEGGEWRAKIQRHREVESFHYFDVGDVKKINRQKERIHQTLVSVQEKLDLSEGGLFKGLYFECGNTQQNQFFMLAHHLVIDMVSWNLLFEDFRSVVKQLQQKEKVQLEKKTASIKLWTESLESLAQSPEIQNEIAYWKSQSELDFPFPKDVETQRHIYREDSIATYRSSIDGERTQFLLDRANEAYNTQTEELLISTLCTTLTDWSGSQGVTLGIERHGRDSETAGISIGNTIGWFTSFFPLGFKKAQNNGVGEQLKLVKERLRSVPNSGIGYGLLKYIAKNDNFSSTSPPQLIFNYLGILKENFEASDISYEYLWEDVRDASSERTNVLEINSFVQNGRLNLLWSYTTDLYLESTIVDLATNFEKNLQALLHHCSTEEGSNYTPSDFPEADLNQDDLDNLMRQFE